MNGHYKTDLYFMIVDILNALGCERYSDFHYGYVGDSSRVKRILRTLLYNYITEHEETFYIRFRIEPELNIHLIFKEQYGNNKL